MSDPIHELANFNAEGLNVTPLPAAEVRRRGERLRRRRQVGASLAGVAAVALVATPLALFAGDGDGGSEPPVAPPGGWVTTIPDDFPVDTGLPKKDGDTSVQSSDRVSTPWFSLPCPSDPATFGSTLPADEKRTDASFVKVSPPAETQARLLAVYADGAAAEAAFEQIGAQGSACGPSPEVEGVTEWRWMVERVERPGDATLRMDAGSFVIETGEPSIHRTLVRVTLVGNALLASVQSDEGVLGTPVDPVIKRHAEVVAAMCVFSEAGCGDEDTTPPEPPADLEPIDPGDIPDDFPLAVNWPSDEEAESEQYGLEGPNRRLEPVTPYACVEFADHDHVDRLRANWTDLEDFRARQLTTFRTADEAVAYVDALEDLYAACPIDDSSPEGTPDQVYEVRPLEAGGQAVSLVAYDAYEGNPGIHLQVHNVIRLGRAVLIDVASNEGGMGGNRHDAAVTRQIDQQLKETAPIVAAMCQFTEAGCKR